MLELQGHMGTLGVLACLGGEGENSQFWGPKLHKTVENGKMNQICRFDLFFGWLARKDIKLGRKSKTFKPQIGPFEPQVSPLEPPVGSFEPPVGPFKPQVGSFDPHVGPFDPNVCPFEPHVGPF